MNLLEIKNLQKYFATQKAVDDISFNIKKGSIFGLLGPNGAGKTTLLRMITGIFYQDSGEINFDGKPFNALKDSENIGYMPEERGLYKKMKIGEQAVYLARLKGLSEAEATKRVKEWFVKFEMQSWWGKKVEDLSKGMSQKLQFVTTVLHNPALIILDEPFSGLDPLNANLIKDEIFRLAKTGSTIIFSTHRMEQVEEICDHIILLNKGKKILDGTINDVKQDFKENVFSLESSLDGFKNLNEFDHLFTLVKQEEHKIKLKIKEAVTPNEILQYFINHQIPITHFNEVMPSLNDIFLKLVEGKDVAARQFETIKN